MENIKQIKVNEELHDIEDAQARRDIASEVINRTNADKALDDKIKAEAEARISADNEQQEKIAELNDKKITKFYANNIGETTLNDSDNGKIQDMMLYGKSEQKSYSGKNLLNPTLKTTTVNGVTCTNNCDGTYTLNGTATNNDDIQIFSGNMTFENAKLIGCPKGGSDTTYRMFMFYDNVLSNNVKDYGSGSNETSVDDKNVKVIINIYSGVTYNNLIFKPMITTDTSAAYDDFEPYVGGIPSPNPDYPQEIKSVVNPKVKVCGKNLFNPDSLVENGACTYSNDELKVIDVNKLANITVPLSIKAGNNINLSFYVKGVKEQSFIVGLKYTNGNKKNVTISINANEFIYNSKTINLSEDLGGIIFGGSGGLGNGTIIKKLQIEIGSQSTEYEPYKVQTATLPYTLNAIPVSSGGNVTIDGQQYIADYVDVEHRKVIRNILKWHLTDLKNGFNNKVWHMYIPSKIAIDGSKLGLSNMFKIQKGHYNGVTPSELYISSDGTHAALNMRGMTDEEFKKWLSEKNPEVYNVLTVAEEIPITPEEALAFKQLMTYYPVTNISVNSEQVKGYTVFNYPISMANGWNYVKQQLNDNRDYIYDMELQSAEAYVNSEYAVTLTELGV